MAMSIPTGGAGPMTLSMIQARTDRRSKRAELPDDIAKKLKSCSVTTCEEWRDLSAYTTYHCFPTGDKNQERWEIWTQLLRKARDEENWIPFRGSLVCSHHFRPQDFVNDPLSKRRKLIKNAIPSVFPTFSVDLDDPLYHLTGEASQKSDDENDDSYEVDESGAYNHSNNFGGDDIYEYEYPSVNDGGHDDIAIVEDDDDDDIQIISEPEISITPNRNQTIPSGRQIHILSTSSTGSQPPQQRLNNQPLNVVTMQSGKLVIVNRNNNSANARVQSRSVTSSPNNVRQQQRVASSNAAIYRKNQNQQKLQRQHETAKALSMLPFSLNNPDLEIDVIEPEPDLADYKLKILELEQAQKSLTDMYENALETQKLEYEQQISVLRKRLRDQNALLSAHQIPIPSKKMRFRPQ